MRRTENKGEEMETIGASELPESDRVKNSDAILEVLRLGSINERQIQDAYPHLMVLVSDIHSALLQMTSGTVDARPVPMLLVLQAHSYFLVAVRVVMGGNLTAIFPILRGGLEAIAYAIIAEQSEANSKIWLDRDISAATKAKCRKVFKFPVGMDRLRLLDAQLAEGYEHSYEASITYGAHPNNGGISPNISVGKAVDGAVPLNMRHIHLATSETVFDAFDALIKFGCLIAAGTRYAMPTHLPGVEVYNLAYATMHHMDKLMYAQVGESGR